MTEKQRRFAEIYAADPNATRAAEMAGYSPRTAYSQGQRLLKNAEVSRYLYELQRVETDKRIITITQARALLSKIATANDVAVTARLRAIDLLLRSAGAVETRSPQEIQPKENDAEDETRVEEKDDFVRIMLPWTGNDTEKINAIQRPDGEIVPLAGSENEDLWIYAMPFSEDSEGQRL